MPISTILSLLTFFLMAFTNLNAEETFKSKLHDYKVTEVAAQLHYPWGLAFLPDNQIIVTEKSGSIKLLSKDGKLQKEIRGGPKVSKCGQGGLMDITLHPNFELNQLLYLSYSKQEDGLCGTEVAKGRLIDSSIENLQTIFVATPKNNDNRHFGSRLLFLPDKTLLISLGDRGHRPNGQDLTTHPGSLIRINEEGGVPEDNPFLNKKSHQPETYSFGHRNIQGLAFDEKNNRIWSVEHGPLGGCELNAIDPGKNYGWAEVTYGRNYRTGTKIGEGIKRKDVEEPAYYWMPSNAPSGMAFYDNSIFPKWKGNLFVSSLTFNLISRLELNDNLVVNEERLVNNRYGRIRHVQVGPDGLIYFLTDSPNGQVLRIEPI